MRTSFRIRRDRSGLFSHVELRGDHGQALATTTMAAGVSASDPAVQDIRRRYTHQPKTPPSNGDTHGREFKD